MSMRVTSWTIAGVCTLAAFISASLSADESPPASLAYDAAGELLLPSDYRTWPCIGTGLNMAYGPLRTEGRAHPPFTNVFVNLDSHREFMQTGKWPDRTVFILEIRGSVAVNSSTSGNNGYYQGEVIGLEAEVKDQQRFEKGWAFFGFDIEKRSSKQIPSGASCYSCHATNAAVENTFVQFYPVLRDVAKKHGTFKAVPEVF